MGTGTMFKSNQGLDQHKGDRFTPPGSLWNDKSYSMTTHSGITAVYKNHNLLKDKPDSFILLVQEIDRTTHIDSAVSILKFATEIQTKIGKFLEDSSIFGTAMVSIGLYDVADKIIASMNVLDLDTFNNVPKRGFLFFTKSSPSIKDYIDKYNETQRIIDALIVSLKEKSDRIIELMNRCDNMIQTHESLVSELNASVLAGKIAIERNQKKLVKDYNEQFLIDKFEARLIDLLKYEHLCIMSFEQMRQMQHNLLSMAQNAQSMITMTYPLWKTAFNSLINRWKSFGSDIKSKPLRDVANDPEYHDVKLNSETIIQTLTKRTDHV